jgi:hypothetical protein
MTEQIEEEISDTLITNDEIDINEKNITINTMDPQPNKKRGRKPKAKPLEPEIKIPKKRGRKPLGKIFDYTKVNLDSLTNDDECIIAHLPIRIGEYEDLNNDENVDVQDNSNNNEEEIGGNKNINISLSCEEFNARDNCRFCEKSSKTIDYLKNKIDELEQNSIENIIANSKKIYKLDLNLYKECGEMWPERSDICCWWCCHKFEGIPIGLPDRFYMDKFYLFGNFCSFNCALSYNINLNDTKLWERYNLLHFLYKKMFNLNNKISPAPARELLKMFGGPLTVEEFRRKTEYLGSFSKSFRTILPPMTTIIPIVEEVLKDNSMNDERLKPIPLNEIKLHKSDLKLKRNKPLPKYKNSLEKIMGLRS